MKNVKTREEKRLAHNKQHREYVLEHREEIRKYRNTYMVSWRKKNGHLYAIKWQRNNPEKIKAHGIVYRAIEKGLLVRKSCEECGATKTHAHHDDYRKPLEVRFLCPACHKQLHTQLDKEEEKMLLSDKLWLNVSQA